jgi:hypothetical protein
MEKRKSPRSKTERGVAAGEKLATRKVKLEKGEKKILTRRFFMAISSVHRACEGAFGLRSGRSARRRGSRK